LLFSLASQIPAMDPSTNETTFTPSMFYATPDQDEYYGPVDIPSPGPIVISSDEDS